MELTQEHLEEEYGLRLTEQEVADVRRGGIVRTFESVQGTGIKTGMAVAVLDVPVDKVWSVIHDHNNFKDFMPNIKESILFDPAVVQQALDLNFDRASSNPELLMDFLREHRISSMNGATGYFFNLLDMPWPLKDLWYIIKLTDLVQENLWKNSWEMLAGNMKSDRGSWTLVPYSEGDTFVLYNAFADPGIVVPDPFVNLALNVGLPGILRAVKRRSKKV